MQEQDTLLLFDVHSLMNRAYYGIAGRSRLTAPDGFPTGALYAFLNMILKYEEELRPTHVISAMDRPGRTFRHDRYPEYKAGRKPSPEDLSKQLPLAGELLEALGFQPVGLDLFEADDLLGTLSKEAEGRGMRVYIVSGDRDTYQLVTEQTSVLLVRTGQSGSVSELVTPREMEKTYGVAPDQWVEIKALMGDASDHIPGVRGVGAKTAEKLIRDYGSLDGVYDHLSELKGALRDKLEADRKSAYLSRELATIRVDAPLPGIDRLLAQTKDDSRDEKALADLLARLGFRSAAERLLVSPQDAVSTREQAIPSYDSISDLVRSSEETEGLAFFLPQGSRQGILATSKAYADLSRPDDLLQLLDRSGGHYITWDLKSQLRKADLKAPARVVHDVMIAAYLLNQLGRSDDIDYALQAALGSSYRPLPDQDMPLLADERKHLAYLAVQLPAARVRQMEAIRERGLDRLYEVESRLTGLLSDMERKGVLIDREALDVASSQMATELDSLEQTIYEDAGRVFNINSPQQLADVLYTDLKLPTGRRSASGQYSTAADELERLRGYHPMIGRLFDYREIAKLRGTFLEGLKKEIASDGRVHTSYNQTVVATGRLSSSNPNLQNIPIRTERGSRIRNLFIAPPGFCLVGADYSQIELRLLAHLSGDPELTKAFREGRDVHRVTAASFYGKDEADVTDQERAVAKTVNFSITYGISDFGLSRDLDIPIAESRRLIERFHAKYPGVETWLKDQGERAKAQGYVETLFHRRRYVPELQSQNRNTFNFGMRAAMNAPVQGTAADLIKIAMVDVKQALDEGRLDAAIILQVHDELVLEVSDQDAAMAEAILKDKMETALTLSVPLVATTRRGKTWGDLK